MKVIRFKRREKRPGRKPSGNRIQSGSKRASGTSRHKNEMATDISYLRSVFKRPEHLDLASRRAGVIKVIVMTPLGDARRTESASGRFYDAGAKGFLTISEV